MELGTKLSYSNGKTGKTSVRSFSRRKKGLGWEETLGGDDMFMALMVVIVSQACT